ncbi:tetraspanin-33-like [Crassostrea virginica]
MPCCGENDSFVSPVVKYVLFFFNLLCWLFGGVIIGIGIWAYLEKQKYYSKEIESVYDVIFDMAIVFFVLGVIIFILGYAGCIGALRENIFLLKFYYFAMLAIFLILLVFAVLAFVFRDKFRQKLTSLLQDNLVITYQDDPDKQSTIDWMQEELGCCGVNTYRDWNKNQYYNCSNDGKGNPSPLACSVPHSCCRVQDILTPGVPNILCGNGVLKKGGDRSLIYTTGCIDAALSLVETELPFIGGVILGICFILLIAMFLSYILERQVQDQILRWHV